MPSFAKAMFIMSLNQQANGFLKSDDLFKSE